MVALALTHQSARHTAQLRRVAWKVITKLDVPDIENLLRGDLPVVVARCARRELDRRHREPAAILP